MKDVLVLLTSAFPFQSGEEFLTEEIKAYSIFKKVYVIPVMVTDFSRRKPVLDNMEVIRLSSIASERFIIKLLGCFKSLFYRDVWDEIRNLVNLNRFSFSALRQLLVDGYKVHSVSKEITEYVKSIVDDNGEKNVLIYSYWMGIHARIASDLKDSINNLVIVTRCHGGDLYEYRYKSNYIPFRSSILRNEDYVFAISNNGVSYLENTYGKALTGQIVLSRLGTKKIFPNSIPTKKNSELNIVSCSYCIPLKRINLIIEALSLISDVGISWTHIGSGIELEHLKRLAEKLIPSNIKYEFLGYVENNTVQELYSSGRFDLFINVSETEGVPVSIMEAMSYGLPIIATDVGGVSEMIDGNGFLLQKDFELEQLSNLLLRMLHIDNDSFAEMSKCSVDIWNKRFNAANNYCAFVQKLYDM